MKSLRIIYARLAICFLIFTYVTNGSGQASHQCGSTAAVEGAAAPTLQDLVNQAARTALTKFADQKLTENQLSITLIDLRDRQHPAQASFRGNERIYPASVVKLFYLGAVHRWLEDKKIEDTDELKRATRDMIVDSSNEATQYIVDVLTHTTSGYELPP